MGKRLILLYILLLLSACSSNDYPEPYDYEHIQVILSNVVVDVEVADTYEKIMRGLMYRDELGELEGMIFIFAQEDPKAFWMKNTTIPLDIIFVNSTMHIVKIHEAVPCTEDPCGVYPSEKPAQFVVEVNKGFSEKYGVEEGMKITAII